MSRFDDIYNSIDSLKRAEAPGHFYAGVRAKMERQAPAEKTRSFILRPVFITSVLFIFLLANIAALSFNNHTEKSSAQTTTATTGAQAFAQEYNLSVQSTGE